MTEWKTIHSERKRLLQLLEGLPCEQWEMPTLCKEWTVEQVVAHVTAGASTTTAAWIMSVLRAGLNTDKHNARLLNRFVGKDNRETLQLYRQVVNSSVAPTKDIPAFLGEVIVHGQDIARPLDLQLRPDAEAVREVAEFYAARDFAVNSKTLMRGLRIEATDGSFGVGDGPLVRGPLLDLVIAMAGRAEGVLTTRWRRRASRRRSSARRARLV